MCASVRALVFLPFSLSRVRERVGVRGLLGFCLPRWCADALSALRADAGCSALGSLICTAARSASAGRVSPRQARHFSLLRHRIAGRSKVPKRKATLRQRPCGFASGQPVVLGHGLRGRTRCRPMAFRSNSCRESEHEVCSLFGDQTQPMPCAPRRWQKGGQPNFQQPAGIVLFG